MSTGLSRIKICGLTRPEDAALAASLGAWALGVIFAPESPRHIDLKQAAEVFRAGREAARKARHSRQNFPGEIECAGVFVNAGMAQIEEAVRECGISAVQLHGEESPGFCTEVKKRLNVKTIKAVRVSDRESVAGVVQFDTDLVLLDTYHPALRGGTGETFDWELAAGLSLSRRQQWLVLSGGLSEENAAEALRAVSPFAIDISSGIESAPGVKDPNKMKKLFQAVDC